MQDVALEILDWGRLGYHQALQRQHYLVEERINGSAADRLVLVEHPSVVTLGRSGSQKDLCISEAALQQRGVELYKVDRGGQATFHGPGQLVAYPIIKLAAKDLHRYLQTLLEVVAAVVRIYGLKPVFINGRPGVWVDCGKIASVGIAVKKWVAYHGIALNINSNLDGFKWIIPCGQHGERITSLQAQLGQSIDFADSGSQQTSYLADSTGSECGGHPSDGRAAGSFAIGHGMPKRPLSQPGGMLQQGHSDFHDPGHPVYARLPLLRSRQGRTTDRRPGRV
jgi:lipoic acid synthetase